MIDNPNLLERSVYGTYWRDGLLDVFAAVGVLLIGILWLAEQVAIAAVVPALLVPLWTPLRQKLVEPRLGHVEFCDARVARNRRHLKLSVLLGIALLLLVPATYLLRARSDMLPAADWAAAIPALLLAILSLLAALLTGSVRFAVYAGILAAAGVCGTVVGWSPGVIFIVAASAMLMIAAAAFTRFVARHPVSGEPQAWR